LQWAIKHKNWSTNQWEKVLFTDESKFKIFGEKRRQYVRRQVGERMKEQYVVLTVKHGGALVMVWGCFSGEKIGDLVKIMGEEIMDQRKYHSIFQLHAFPCGKKIVGYGFVFQQDNDPKHTLKLCRNYIINKEKKKELKYINWLPQSPDLNSIELLWDKLDRNVRKMRPVNRNQLWEFLQIFWTKISVLTLKKLIEKMPRICTAVCRLKKVILKNLQYK